MSQRRKHLKRQLEEAERELDAAKKPSQIRAAATKRRLALQGYNGLSSRSPSRALMRAAAAVPLPHDPSGLVDHSLR
jgi:hypothetical protein